MSLLSDTDAREILKIKEEKGNWFLNSFRQFFGIERQNRIYNENFPLTGLEYVGFILNKSGITYSLSEEFEKSIPTSGPFIIIANHPLVGIDSLILLHVICKIRPDFKVQDNFLLQRIEPLKDYIIPVNLFENFESEKSHSQGLRECYNHLKDGKPIGIFPAGEVTAYQHKKHGIIDPAWKKSSITFIKNAEVPVLPICIKLLNNTSFFQFGNPYIFPGTDNFYSEINNKRNFPVKLEIRKPVSPKTIKSFPKLESLMQYLRATTYSLNGKAKKNTSFKFHFDRMKEVKQPVIDPVDINLITDDLRNLEREHLLFMQGNFSVYCAPFKNIPNVIIELGRLREITFRAIGEGTNKNIDLDQYDIYYNHLIIYDNIKNQIVGAYRIGKGKDILSQFGKKGFYISSLFKLKNEFNKILGSSLELGRSFIIKEYQRHPLVLFLLWKGILCFLLKNPEYKYLLGPVSISNDYSKQSKSLIVQFINRNYLDSILSPYVNPRKKFKISRKLIKKNNIILDGVERNTRTLDLYINEYQPNFSIPVLLKRYLQVNGKVLNFNIDPDFNNCLDGFMIVNISDIPIEMVESLSKEITISQRQKEIIEEAEVEQTVFS